MVDAPVDVVGVCKPLMNSFGGRELLGRRFVLDDLGRLVHEMHEVAQVQADEFPKPLRPSAHAGPMRQNFCSLRRTPTIHKN